MIETSRLALHCPLLLDNKVIRNLWKDEKVRKFLGEVIFDKEIDLKISEIDYN